MKLAVLGMLLIVVATPVGASELQVCDQLGVLARIIAEKRDAGITGATLRQTLRSTVVDRQSKAAVDVLITEIYSTDGRTLGPDDLAAKVTEGCLDSGD